MRASTTFPILFLKAIKNQAGYALYGRPARWHKISADKPAPGHAHHVAMSHYQVQAIKKLHGDDGFHALAPHEQTAKVKGLAAELQSAASASAAVSGWKKAMLAGEKPTPAQMKAFQALPDDKRAALLALVQTTAGQAADKPSEPAVKEKAPPVNEKAPVVNANGASDKPADAPAPAPAAPKAEPKIHPMVLSQLDTAHHAGNTEFLQNVVKNNPDHPHIQAHAQKLLDDLKAKAAPAPAPKPKPETPKPTAHPAATANASVDWHALTLPPENVNAGSINKKVAALKAAAEAGDVAAIQAMKFGVNTYNKKLAAAQAKFLQALGAGAGPAVEPVKVAKVAEVKPAPAEPAKAAPPPSASPAPQRVAKVKVVQSKPAAPAPAAAPAPVAAAAPAHQSVTLHNTKPGHNKFYKITVKGNEVHSHYGKLNTAGVTGVKTYSTAHHAHAQAKLLLNAKLKKGYEVKGGGLAATATAGAAAAAPAGPKEGDTKQGADGMLVLKNGHWVKVGPAQSTAKWDLTEENPGFSGGKTAESTDGIWVAGINEDEGFEFYPPFDDPEEFEDALDNSIHAETLAELIEKVAAKGYKIPSSEVQEHLSPSAHEAPAPVDTGPLDISAWKQVGPQGGSNPGGVFESEDGTRYYCKFPSNAEHAHAEVLAAKLYELAGIPAPISRIVKMNGKVGIASLMDPSLKHGVAELSSGGVKALKAGFAADAWLGNRDVVGVDYHNVMLGKDGKPVRIDVGASLMFRAQGGAKEFGPNADEVTTLLDAKVNAQTAAAFKGITKADITAGVAKLSLISDDAIAAAVHASGLGTPESQKALIQTLLDRRADLLKRYPAAKKKAAPKKKPFNPDKISEPPSFLDWGGSGKPGPSSHEFVNKSNHEAVQAIYAAAKSGKSGAVENLELPIYDKSSGNKTGVVKALSHPSQHVKGYAQQAVNEVEYQLNPPKRFRFEGGHPLAALHSAYPAHKGAAAPTAKKVAKFLLAGNPGKASLQQLAMPAKVTHKSGKLTQATYSKAAQTAYAKMPVTQRQAIASYTGAAYGGMNNSLWNGNPTGAAKAAGEALHTLGHTIEPGTVLSRKVSLHGENLQAVLGSTGMILQEPAIMSTSIRPSSWSGNVQLKMHVGPGVKGLWVGPGSKPGGAISKHASEDEMILPPNTRLLILNVRTGSTADDDGFGGLGVAHVIEAVILPSN